MKTWPDEQKREHLTYEERTEAYRLLHKLWGESTEKKYTKADWNKFGFLIERSCRVPPGPEGADTPGCGTFEVGQEWGDGDASGVIKKLRICGSLREVYGLIQINSHNHGLVWLKLGELREESNLPLRR